MFSVEIFPLSYSNITQCQSVHPSQNAAIVAARNWAKTYAYVFVADRDGKRIWQSKALRNNPYK